MAWNYEMNQPDKELIWDLRQTYAEVVSEVLRRIASLRYEKDYAGWFSALDDLHTEVNQKMDDTEKDDYEDLFDATVEILNLYPNAYNRKSTAPKEVFAIYSALKTMEIWLKEVMERHKMFGAKEDAELL